MVPRAESLAWPLLPLLLLALAGCRRGIEDWRQELASQDPWRREMGALALRSVDDGKAEQALRILLKRPADREPRVTRAISGSLAALAPRAVGALIAALSRTPPDRVQQRELLVGLLTDCARAGDERARSALREHLQAELESGEPERAGAARARLDELESRAPGS